MDDRNNKTATITKQELEEIRERRINAVVDMAKAAYQVDEYGLANLVGMSRTSWTRNRNARWGEKSAEFFFALSTLTTVSASWMLAEEYRVEE